MFLMKNKDKPQKTDGSRTSIPLKQFFGFAVILCIALSAQQALAGGCDIRSGPGWIRGEAVNAPLETVLQALSDHIGVDIYVDEKIKKDPVSFQISQNLSPEKAIKEMMGPFSHAVVFGKTGEGEFEVLQINVFQEGQQYFGNYVQIAANPAKAAEARAAMHKNRAIIARSGKIGSNTAGIVSSPDAGRSIAGKNLIKPNFEVGKNIFGQPVIKHSNRNGSDHRLSAFQMQQAYQKFQSDKTASKKSAARSAFSQAKQVHRYNKQVHVSQRNEMLRKYIQNNMKR